jgi:hypothetical protein
VILSNLRFSFRIAWSMSMNDENARRTEVSCVPDKEITRNDVLLGRGAASDRFEGNVQFRTLIRARKNEYSSSMNPNGKAFIAQQIVQTIQSNQGRFLRKVKLSRSVESPKWEIVSDSVAVEKVKQAFRDMDHRASTSRRGNDNLTDPLSAPPMVNGSLIRSAGAETLPQRDPTTMIGHGASGHLQVHHRDDPAPHFFSTDQRSRAQIQAVTLPPASSASLSQQPTNILRGSQSTATESENHAMVLLADLATHELSGNNATIASSLIPTFPGTISNAPITTNETNPIPPRPALLGQQPTDPSNLSNSASLSMSAPTMEYLLGVSTQARASQPPPPPTHMPMEFLLAASTRAPESQPPLLLLPLPVASPRSRLDLSVLAPDLLQRLSEQVAYRDLSNALAAPPPGNQFTAAPFSLPTVPPAAAAMPARGVDWMQLLSSGSIPLLAYQDLVSLVSPPPNPSASISALLAAAFAAPNPTTAAGPTAVTTIPLDPSVLSNVAWDQVPGHYLSHLPLVQSGRLGPFTSTDWYLMRTALARAEATRNGLVLIQIRTVLQTAMTLPLHRVVLTREDIVAMAETLQRLTVLLSTVGGSVPP